MMFLLCRFTPATVQRKAAYDGAAGRDTMLVPLKQRPQTLDARFASMKENRMRVISSQQKAFHDNGRYNAQRRRFQQQQLQQRPVQATRGGALSGRRPGYYVK
ncbi:uncharacterized protein LOC109848897 [Asparagus officinalis]|uniref:uncharacterized protein LOC109848897 n=1 Tax=Asparagus officinalis TaxID=4686 RepID=UPI00098E80E6|nr:uncharacterized protein LOC109848897 [Asparagus officinalis]